MSSKPIRLFVYGTLQQGEENFSYLKQSHFIERANTAPLYTLFSLGDYPAMIAGGNTSVCGEVYQVTFAILKRLDKLEEHPDLYRRQDILLLDNRKVLSYLFMGKLFSHCPEISLGDWKRFRQENL